MFNEIILYYYPCTRSLFQHTSFLIQLYLQAERKLVNSTNKCKGEKQAEILSIPDCGRDAGRYCANNEIFTIHLQVRVYITCRVYSSISTGTLNNRLRAHWKGDEPLWWQSYRDISWVLAVSHTAAIISFISQTILHRVFTSHCIPIYIYFLHKKRTSKNVCFML